jgi:hypothetical protein
VPAAGREKIQFVKFGKNETSSSAAVMPMGEVNTLKRNRGKVISLARQMLEAGTSKERIKELLPVTEAELALLQSEK